MADNYKLGEKTYVAVLDMPEITANATFDHKYEGIAKYPSVTRDLSMVMKKEILAGQIEDVIEQRGGRILESYKLFDVYEGSQSQQATSQWLTPLPSAPKITPWRRRE